MCSRSCGVDNVNHHSSKITIVFFRRDCIIGWVNPMEKPLSIQETKEYSSPVPVSLGQRQVTIAHRETTWEIELLFLALSVRWFYSLPTRHLGLFQGVLLARLHSLGICEELKGYLTRKEEKQSVLPSDDVSSNKARDAERSGRFAIYRVELPRDISKIKSVCLILCFVLNASLNSFLSHTYRWQMGLKHSVSETKGCVAQWEYFKCGL